MDKFYMVWKENDRSPRIKHISKILARNEAERLAESNPNDAFYVMEAISISKCIRTITEELK